MSVWHRPGQSLTPHTGAGLVVVSRVYNYDFISSDHYDAAYSNCRILLLLQSGDRAWHHVVCLGPMEGVDDDDQV